METTAINPYDGMGPFGFTWFATKRTFASFKCLLTKKFYISIAVMAILWLFIGLAKVYWPSSVWVYVLSILTFAQGGFYGGIIGSIGGVLGKGVIGSTIIRTLMGSASNGQIREFGENTNKFSSICSWIFGVGLGLALFNFGNANMIKENCIIGLFLFIICLKMQKDPDSLFIVFVNSFVKGRPQNPKAAKYFVAGCGYGSLIGFILVWFVNRPNLGYLAGMYTALLSVLILCFKDENIRAFFAKVANKIKPFFSWLALKVKGLFKGKDNDS